MKLRSALAPMLSALFVVLGVVGPAAAEVSGVEGPHAEGAFELERSQCTEDTVRSDSGSVLGHTDTCLYVYGFDNLSELDIQRDYGAAWMHARFTPAAGWCTTGLGAGLDVGGVRFERGSKTAVDGVKATTKLALDANGLALQEGRISQTTGAPGGRTTVQDQKGGGASQEIDWRGKTSKPMSLVGGVGYSYELLGGTGKISYGFKSFSLATC